MVAMHWDCECDCVLTKTNDLVDKLAHTHTHTHTQTHTRRLGRAHSLQFSTDRGEVLVFTGAVMDTWPAVCVLCVGT